MKTEHSEIVLVGTGRTSGLHARLGKRLEEWKVQDRWQVRTFPEGKSLTGKCGGRIFVVIAGKKYPLQGNRYISTAIKQQATDPQNNFVVIQVGPEGRLPIEMGARLREVFPEPSKVEIAQTDAQVDRRVADAISKREAERRRVVNASVLPPRPSPLDEAMNALNITSDLRESSGNLSIKPVADLFGLSLADFARWLGCSRQTLSNAPDADSLQTALLYFERIARLRGVLKNDEAFRKWLRMSNPALDGRTPLELVRKKQWQALADFVDDILTGSPT